MGNEIKEFIKIIIVNLLYKNRGFAYKINMNHYKRMNYPNLEVHSLNNSYF